MHHIGTSENLISTMPLLQVNMVLFPFTAEWDRAV